MDDAIEIGIQRQKLHANYGTPRLYDDPNIEDVIGAKGEKAWELLTGIPMDTLDRLDGDDNDFVQPLNFTFDIKTARKAYNLLVKVTDERKPIDIDVLAEYDECSDKVHFIGWQWRSVMLKQPTKDFGIGVDSHYMHKSKLRPMGEILSRLPR